MSESDSDSERRSQINSNSDSEIILNDLDKRLLYAAKVGVAEDVQSLIQEGADIHVVNDRSLIKSFIILILSSLPKGIWESSLIKHLGSDHQLFHSGNNGLHISGSEGHDEVIEIFLDHGVDVNCRGRKSNTPLTYAATSGQYSSTKLFLDRGAIIDIQDEDGKSPIFWGSNHPDIIGSETFSWSSDFIVEF